MRSPSMNIIIPLAVALCALQGCSAADAPTEPRGAGAVANVSAAADSRHLVVFAAQRVPDDVESRVAALGGRVDRKLAAIGVAVVTGLTGEAVTTLAAAGDVLAVEADVISPADAMDAFTTADPFPTDASDVVIQSHALPTEAEFYARQWNMHAIQAEAAWATDFLGSPEVSVAILDSGIDYDHPELAGRVDLARSISLAPAEDARVEALFSGRHPITDLHGHGTASTGLVVSNAHVLAAVTQRTTVFGVKTSNGRTGTPLSVGLEALMYAADNEADVVHVAFSTTFQRSANPGLVAAVVRTVNYVHRRGAVIVTFSGNTIAPQNVPGGVGDYDKDKDRFRFCNAPHVICVAATGPASAASLVGPWTDADRVAPYSNFGFSAIDVAAPGGTPGLRGLLVPELAIWVLCSQTAVTEGPPFFACRTSGSLIASSNGTSWSAAQTSALAALLVSVIGKDRPNQIQALIKNSADDLGDPGFDARYGRGRINVGRAVGVVP